MKGSQPYGVPDEENPEWTADEIRTAKPFAFEVREVTRADRPLATQPAAPPPVPPRRPIVGAAMADGDAGDLLTRLLAVRDQCAVTLDEDLMRTVHHDLADVGILDQVRDRSQEAFVDWLVSKHAEDPKFFQHARELVRARTT